MRSTVVGTVEAAKIQPIVENRRCERIRLSLPCQFLLPDGASHQDGVTVDISRSGVLIESSNSNADGMPRAGGLAEVEVALLHSGHHPRRCLRGWARVVRRWLSNEGSVFLALEFTSLTFGSWKLEPVDHPEQGQIYQ